MIHYLLFSVYFCKYNAKGNRNELIIDSIQYESVEQFFFYFKCRDSSFRQKLLSVYKKLQPFSTKPLRIQALKETIDLTAEYPPFTWEHNGNKNCAWSLKLRSNNCLRPYRRAKFRKMNIHFVHFESSRFNRV